MMSLPYLNPQSQYYHNTTISDSISFLSCRQFSFSSRPEVMAGWGISLKLMKGELTIGISCLSRIFCIEYVKPWKKAEFI